MLFLIGISGRYNPWHAYFYVLLGIKCRTFVEGSKFNITKHKLKRNIKDIEKVINCIGMLDSDAYQ